MELTIKEFEKPIITFNSDEIKAELQTKLAEYNGLVVTEDTLPACKTSQKELARLRKDLDDYRKEKKQLAEQPIKAFEKEVKDLIALVDMVEKPLKEEIGYFDEKRRQEKLENAQSIADSLAVKFELNDKYKAQIVMEKSYSNLSATEKAVTESIEQQCFKLKMEQDREETDNKMIANHILYLNKKYDLSISVGDSIVQKLISDNENVGEVIVLLTEYAGSLVATKTINDTPVEEKSIEIENTEPQTMYYATYQIIGSVSQLQAVSKFLNDNNIEYEVREQGECDD